MLSPPLRPLLTPRCFFRARSLHHPLLSFVGRALVEGAGHVEDPAPQAPQWTQMLALLLGGRFRSRVSLDDEIKMSLCFLLVGSFYF